MSPTTKTNKQCRQYPSYRIPPSPKRPRSLHCECKLSDGVDAAQFSFGVRSEPVATISVRQLYPSMRTLQPTSSAFLRCSRAWSQNVIKHSCRLLTTHCLCCISLSAVLVGTSRQTRFLTRHCGRFQLPWPCSTRRRSPIHVHSCDRESLGSRPNRNVSRHHRSASVSQSVRCPAVVLLPLPFRFAGHSVRRWRHSVTRSLDGTAVRCDVVTVAHFRDGPSACLRLRLVAFVHGCFAGRMGRIIVLPQGFLGREAGGVGSAEQIPSQDRLGFRAEAHYTLMPMMGVLVPDWAIQPHIATAVDLPRRERAYFARSGTAGQLEFDHIAEHGDQVGQRRVHDTLLDGRSAYSSRTVLRVGRRLR